MKIIFGIFLLGALLAPANSLPSEERTNGKKTLSAFSNLLPLFQDHSAVLYEGWSRCLYGVIISEDGYLLTKASEVQDKQDLSVRIGNVKYPKPKIVAINEEWDVALLKVDAQNLNPIEWAGSKHLERGDWVISNGSTTRSMRRLRAGVISANAREIGGPSSVVLGVGLELGEDGLRVVNVIEKSGAEEAGIQIDDIILKADGQEIEKQVDLLKILKKRKPDDQIKLTLKRADKELELEVKLQARPAGEAQGGGSRNDQMSGPISARRDNFPSIIQHDTQMSHVSVGGPLFTLDGKCVGMNIAYANRVEIFSIPAEEMKKISEELLANAE